MTIYGRYEDAKNQCDLCGKVYAAGEGGMFGFNPETSTNMDICFGCLEAKDWDKSGYGCQRFHKRSELDDEFKCPHDRER